MRGASAPMFKARCHLASLPQLCSLGAKEIRGASETIGLRAPDSDSCSSPSSSTPFGFLFKPPKMRIPKRPFADFRLLAFSFLSDSQLSTGANLLHRRGYRVSACKKEMEDCGMEGNKRARIWSSPGKDSSVKMGKMVFCNRSLNMKNIVAVGFDMDYTLAQYKPETFEALAYEGTVRKLVTNLQYPIEILNWKFDWKYMVRGLVLDKKRGNILKMDRHKYVKVAYHGFKEMSKEEKIKAYGKTLIRDTFDEPEYALIDTLFSLAEAYLFAQLVDFKDNYPGKFPPETDYGRMYKDVRAAVDMCHRDGSLKRMVAQNPGKYINEDLSIVPMIKMLRESGRAVFLVTNSLWDYTNVVMSFLCGTHNMEVGLPRKLDWIEKFDMVITGSSKPGFFHEENRANLFQVDPETGMLQNTENGIPIPQIGTTLHGSSSKELRRGKVFQGGNVAHLHKLLGIEASYQVLYVGDHIYGDILRSKKALGWRTMLVVPELEKEVELLWDSRKTQKELRRLRRERDLIEDQIHRLNWSLMFDALDDYKRNQFSLERENLESERDRVRHQHQNVQRERHQNVWGQLMKTGYQNSRFAHQVDRFACLYTSQVTNLGLYSPEKYYRPTEDFMPHEFDILED
ncbi:5'-nucleotidase domain-containing protein 4 isoform X2 [Phalaenopsis equestris]|uniref:5'-nucleotidase domain-containing protein 4 isoform X2 n=1 Tax=Phalaenopsis equestris TaxID=78828 RepID=UPI0009E5DC91|nr:5'-nucleotidase domain-containing protein 4 isoform X2 [Phalaenopsis equestris]